MGNLLNPLFICIPNDFKYVLWYMCMSESGFLHFAEIQFSSVTGLPVSAACFLCI